MQTLKTLGLAAALTALAASGASAQTGILYAVPAQFPGDISGATAQVGVNGPGSGQTYLDVEGSGTGANSNGVPYETFGVIDFTGNFISDANGNLTTLASVGPNITVGLGDQPFGSTAPGALDFYLSDSTASLSSLKYDTSAAGALNGGLGNQLSNLYFLGATNYLSTPASPVALPGQSLAFSFNLLPAEQSLLASELSTAGNIRLVVAADTRTPSVVGSFAGAFGGNTGNVPSLTLTAIPAAVPEASTTVSLGLLLALGLGGLAVARRRKAQA